MGVEHYRAILQTSLDGFVTVDTAGHLLDVNETYCQMTGYTRDELLAMTVADLDAGEDHSQAERRLQSLMETGSGRLESQHSAKDGRLIDVEVSAAYLPRESQIVAFIRDITQRKRDEEALRESEERYRQIIETAQEGIWLIAEDSTVSYVNARLAAMLGYSREEIVGRSVDSFIEEKNHLAARTNRERRRQGLKEQYLFTFRRKDGSLLHTIVSSNPLFDKQGAFRGSLGMLTDITEQTLAEAERAKLGDQLRQAQKMESIGRLAGGVAHDFNNLLTVINGYSELLLKGMKPGNKARAYVSQIREAGERAANLTQQLLAFSRKQIVQPQTMCLNTLVADAETFLAHVVGEQIELIIRRASSSSLVLADPSQAHQVLMNLAVNARDAMPNGGKLIIETSTFEVTPEYAASNPDAAPGSYAVLTVTDTGIGMAEDTLRNIFEPFFTTKEKGKGTGLGLSTVYGIVRQTGGWISVESQPKVGTTFRIYLPRLDDATPGPQPCSHATADPHGSETVLVVEDEEDVRQLAVTVLISHGYRVLDAANGRLALQVADRHPGPIHVMLTDVIMPGMNGRELADCMKSRRPDVKVLFMSGYTEDVIAPQRLREDRIALIQKPFTPDELISELRALLTRPENN
ncbi:MAG: PAS domain S-box protein [Acidobacteriales bacterium]|nr:PAS domain S-box protein [Terriglobales bacterium]